RRSAVLPARADQAPARAIAADRLDADALLDVELDTLADVGPQHEQLLLGHGLAADAAVAGELERAGHDDLGARVVGDGAAVAILADDLALEAGGDEGQRRGEAGGARADDDRVELARPAAAARSGDGRGGLAALLDGVPDQAHAAELADDEDAGLGGLEARRE